MISCNERLLAGNDYCVVRLLSTVAVAVCALALPTVGLLIPADRVEAQSGLPVAGEETPQESEASPKLDRSLADAVFTRRQAARGERRFQQACASCHRADEMTRSLRSGVHETVGDVFQQISTTMPQAMPGSLSAEDYADILAFIFRLSDYPAGDEELPADLSLLKSLHIEAP